MGLWDSFMGKDQANDIQAGRVAADQSLGQGLDRLTETRGQYLDRSLGEFDAVKPDIAMGRDASNIYRAALGLDGPDAQRAYFSNFNNDPGYDAVQKAAVGAVEGSAANRGGLFSGSTLQGITDRVALLKKSMFEDRMNRLGQLGSQGSQLVFNTATSRSNLLNSTGTDIGNAQFGVAQLKANNATNEGNALAASRSIPINNLLSIMQSGAKVVGAAAMGSDRRLKTDISEVGKLPNGLPVYLFRYKSGGPMQLGLMADEVEKVHPEAVITGPHGVKMVHYDVAVR